MAAVLRNQSPITLPRSIPHSTRKRSHISVGSRSRGTMVSAVLASADTVAPPAVVVAPRPVASPPILSREEVLERLHALHRHAKTDTYRAMYSSIVGGITRDPAAMVIPLDDHMVHRGHAVFDTAIIRNGNLYELEPHLDRFMRSAKGAKIPHTYSREEVRATVIATAAASGVREGHMRYWLSVGPGGFLISPAECPKASFYVMAIHSPWSTEMSPGIKMVTSTIPMKSWLMSTTKNVNYLANVHVHVEAQERGADEALWIDERGYIAEGPTMNVAFVSEDKYLLVPSFERILAGCTVRRVMKLAERLLSPLEEGAEPLLKGVRHAPVTEAEARGAAEMMLIGSGSHVKPVTEWDKKLVGKGDVGPVAKALFQMLQKDFLSGPLTPIPYNESH